MTRIRKLYTFPNPDNTRRPAEGSVIWTPTDRRVIAGTPDEEVLPIGFVVELVAGELDVSVAPSGTSWVWRVDEKIKGLPTRTKYLVVPDVEEKDLTELQQANLSTLIPGSAPDHVWYIYTDHLAEQAMAAKLAAQAAQAAAESADNDSRLAETGALAAQDSAEVAQAASEAAQALSESAQVASQAARDVAIGARDSATASAALAVTKASDAGTSAFNAGTSAAAALGHRNAAQETIEVAENIAEDLITTADNHRVAAASSAASAATSKSEAETARTGAQTARTGAETARTGAETAKTAAETARDISTAKAAEANLNATGFSIGTVTTVGPTTPAAASVGGVAPNRVLDLVIPKGNTGVTPNIQIGTVTTGTPNPGVPGSPGSGGPQGIQGPPGDMVSVTGPANASGTVTIAIGDLPTTRNWTLTGNITIILPTPTNAKSGTITLVITQDATGGRTVTWPANTILKWPDGIAQQPAIAANSLSIIHLMWTGYVWVGMLGGKSFA